MGDAQDRTRKATDDPKTIAGKLGKKAKEREKALQDIFDDNSTGRPKHPDFDKD